MALRIPEKLVITLGRVFEDEAVAELLTTNKLSELACLTLYLMYEKKAGQESFWYEYIKVSLVFHEALLEPCPYSIEMD